MITSHWMKKMGLALMGMTISLMALSGCATKGRVELVEGNVSATQEEMKNFRNSTEQGQQNLRSDLAALSQKLDEISKSMNTLGERMAAIEKAQEDERSDREALRAETRGHVDKLGDYKSDYDKTWNQINTIERDLGSSVRELQKLSDANRSAIDTLKTDVDAKHTAVSTKLDRAQTDLTARIETTNQDLTTFRKQVSDHFDTLKQSYISLGKAIYEIVKLQYTQFQSVTEEYTKTMSQIEAQLPAATLGSFEPKESLAP